MGVLALLTLSLAGALAAGLIRASSANAAVIVTGTSYTVTTGAGAIVPGTTDIGNHCDDCTTGITLPFNYAFYGGVTNTAIVSSNGMLEFFGTNTAPFTQTNLPAFNNSIYPLWDDQWTFGGLCPTLPGAGVFTSTSGVAPHRIFNIEWRTCQFGNTLQTNDYEVRLHEDSSSFDVVYGAVTQPSADGIGTIGVQKDAGNWTQDTDFNGGIPAGTLLHFSLVQSTTTTVTCVPASPAVNQSVTCTATVAPAVGGTPTGTVAFTDNGAPIAGCTARPLNEGNPDQATCTFTESTAGAHNIVATYSGDANFTGSSGSFLLSVGKAPTTTTVSCAPNPANFGQPVTCTATVTAQFGGTPTGTVTFEDNGVIIAGCFAVPLNQLNPDQASCTFTPATTGSHTITAIYSGDANFAASTGTTTLVVQGGTLTVTKNLISNPLDPSKFNLRIDGVTKAACVGNNGTTGPVTVSVGFHNVSETACAGTNIFAFTTYIKCVDQNSGVTVAAGYTRSLTFFVNNGQSIGCTIRNQRKLVRIT